jgi:hypothetical protein
VAMVVLRSIWPSIITNSSSLSSSSVKIKLERGLNFVSSAFRSSSVNTPHSIVIGDASHNKDVLISEESSRSRRLQTEVHDSGLGNSLLQCYFTILVFYLYRPCIALQCLYYIDTLKYYYHVLLRLFSTYCKSKLILQIDIF